MSPDTDNGGQKYGAASTYTPQDEADWGGFDMSSCYLVAYTKQQYFDVIICLLACRSSMGLHHT
jgi:hypothetical protein